MKNYEQNLETSDITLEVVDSAELPSLDDLMIELEAVEIAETNLSSANFELKDDDRDYIEIIEPDAAGEEIEQLRNELHRVNLENNELSANYERIRNDFEKYRWRTERERSEHYTFAVISVVREFLPILDNFGRALMNAQNACTNDERQDFTHFLSGVIMIYQQTNKFLTDVGVSPINAVGEPFDPQYHEAVAVEASSAMPANVVLEEILRGYRMGDKLVRASMVKVSTNFE